MLRKIISNSQNKCQIQHSNSIKEDNLKFKITILKVTLNKDFKEIIISKESIEVSLQMKEYHKISNKSNPKYNKIVDILTQKITKVQKEVIKDHNKKFQKLTMKVFIHKINKLMMFIIITFYIKIRELVEVTMSNQYKTFINAKITLNKLMQKKWKK